MKLLDSKMEKKNLFQYESLLMQYIEIFSEEKNENFTVTQRVPTMYVLDHKKIRYTPANPCFSIIKVRCKGVFISRTCFPDGHL